MGNGKILRASYAGLLHDIGKIEQRTQRKCDLSNSELSIIENSQNENQSYLHAGYSYRFVKEILKMEDDFSKAIGRHHCKDDNLESQILFNADNIASRIDFDDEENDTLTSYNDKIATRRMNSIFNLVDFGKPKNNDVFKISNLSSLDKLSPNNVPNIQEANKEYKDLYDTIVSKIKDAGITSEISRSNYDKLYSILQEYTSTVPSSTYKMDESYVSLFDHLKLSSAIAGCLAYNNNSKMFNMLEFDVSGIQKFIYKITEGSESKKGIAKALRGRSFLIFLITNYISYSFLNLFGLTQANVIFNTGGGALLLLPDEEDIEKKIQDKYKEISNYLYEMFKLNLCFVYSMVKCNDEELENYKIEKSIDVKANIENNKSHKFANIISEDFYFEAGANKKICSKCGLNLIEKGDECETCNIIENISDFITKHKSYSIYYSYDLKAKDSILTIGNDSIRLSDEQLDNYDYVDSINSYKIGNIRYKSGDIPLKDEKALNFEDICNLIPNEKGDKKLAILKMDVDNLGAIFAYGMNKDTRSLSKYLTLSRMMENFFGVRLQKICQNVSKSIDKDIKNKVDNETMFYINYAGGDDLVIMGPVSAIIELVMEIHNKFKEFVGNENITLSGGIHIQHPKQPIRYGVLSAEEYLSKAKNADGKNSICLLDTVVSFDEFDQVLSNVERLIEYIEKGVLSRTLMYQYMTILDNKNYNQFIEFIPRILYSIQRNVSKEKVIEIKDIFVGINNNELLAKRVLEFKLAIMLTREV